VIDAHPEFPVVQTHQELRVKIGRILAANHKVSPRALQMPVADNGPKADHPWLLICNVAGTLAPEPWIEFQKIKNIEELKITTAHEPDYDKLMNRRMEVLRKHDVKLQDVFNVVERVKVYPGAKEFMEWIKPVLPRTFMLSDTFEEYALPICEQLGHPMVFCNFLEADDKGFLARHIIRMKSPATWTSSHSYQKLKAVEEFQRLNFRILAVGFSFNDIGMLNTAEKGILFNPSDKVQAAHPELPVVRNYEQLKGEILKTLGLTPDGKRRKVA